MVYILVLFTILSCSGDDDTVLISSNLEGVWNLTNISGGFVGINKDFKKGIITWDFNEANKTVKITNKDLDNQYGLLSPGTYTYKMVKKEDKEELVINDMIISYFKRVTTSKFIIDEEPIDGFRYIFER
ncbi:hypothetical protein [Aquimarina longa]|uniref:hypothetical protein n=1 Tax=Aquimarina longa TaxID=1080221 RepID=UPI0011DFADA6|nr:hypothetical protein [Aquimarina longa]